MSKNEVLEWLNCLPGDAQVAIDDGGLALVEVGNEGGAYLEVGGVPEKRPTPSSELT